MKRFLTCLLLWCLFVPALHASTIPVSGTFRTGSGNTLNGRIRLSLSYAGGVDTTDNTLVVAQSLEFPVNNGALPSTAKITPNDRISPANTWWTLEAFNSYGTRVYRANYYVTGTSFNFSQAIPTPITTSNISFTDVPTGSGTTDCIVVWLTPTTQGCTTDLTGDTATIDNEDGLTVNGVVIPQVLPVTVHVQTPAAMINQSFFVSNASYQVTAIQFAHATAESTASALHVQITKETGTSAPGTGGELLTNNTNDGFNGKSTANVVQSGNLTLTEDNLQLASGDRLSLQFEAAATELAGVTVTVYLKRIN